MEYQKQHKQLVIWLVRSETLATRVMSYDGKITKILQNLLQNNSETVASIHDKEITKKRYIYIYIYIYPDERQKIIENLRLIIIA